MPDASLQRLAEGFTSLLDEYNTLLLRSQALERQVRDAKSRLSRLGFDAQSAPNDDSSRPGPITKPDDIENPQRIQPSTEKWWKRDNIPMSRRNLQRTRHAADLVTTLGMGNLTSEDAVSKISSQVVETAASSAMPSIVESPLEQDFTVAGTPSRLDCPFASMSNRRLSAHAASVVSRYKPGGVMTPRSSTSRLNAQDTQPRSAHQPTSAGGSVTEANVESTKKATTDIEASLQGSAPQCPIRFLDKNSPEEVAEYFEKHKHELPRSHEVCVKRYQSNADSIRQLDAKYGNLVSMIQGLGEKHVPLLPDKQEEQHIEPGIESDRVMRWASDVSNVAQMATDSADGSDRQPRFDRPLKDVRLGESPSRPWGIQVPLSTTQTHLDSVPKTKQHHGEPSPGKKSKGCPFAGHVPPGVANPHVDVVRNADEDAKVHPHGEKVATAKAQPVFLASTAPVKQSLSGGELGSIMNFTGPVFIGYSPEDAATVLRLIARQAGDSKHT